MLTVAATLRIISQFIAHSCWKLSEVEDMSDTFDASYTLFGSGGEVIARPIQEIDSRAYLKFGGA